MIIVDNQPKLSSTNSSKGRDKTVDLLILGAGWTAEFLISIIEKGRKNITYQTTTTNGGGKFNSIKFKFNPTQNQVYNCNEFNQFNLLPNARSILISFPIKDPGASEFLLKNYALSRSSSSDFQFESIDVIQLGSSGIFDGGPTLSSKDGDYPKKFQATSTWIDRHSSYDEKNPRAGSEDELLRLNDSPISGVIHLKFRTTVLNLSGLWGGQRSIRNYVNKVAPSMEILKSKTSVHMIHGLDVARCIMAVLDQFTKAAGQRWILTDQRVYDWWDLASAWGESSLDNRDTETTIGPQASWVNQLLQESNLRALPRSPDQLGRALDSREFWKNFNLTPVRARLEHYH